MAGEHFDSARAKWSVQGAADPAARKQDSERAHATAFAESVTDLSKLLCTQTQGGIDTFTQMAYVKKGFKAIEHLFCVAAGLDSQILGDYEIVGQIKKAFKNLILKAL